jgi:hypothetical protein
MDEAICSPSDHLRSAGTALDRSDSRLSVKPSSSRRVYAISIALTRQTPARGESGGCAPSAGCAALLSSALSTTRSTASEASESS